MMQKLISLMILISAAFLLPASDKPQLVNAASQALHIGGYYKTNVAITTDPIYLSDDSAQGMPFKLLSEDVSSQEKSVRSSSVCFLLFMATGSPLT